VNGKRAHQRFLHLGMFVVAFGGIAAYDQVEFVFRCRNVVDHTHEPRPLSDFGTGHHGDHRAIQSV